LYARQVENAVVAFVPVREAFLHLAFGCTRIEAEEGVREVAAMVVELLREIIGFRLARASYVRRHFVGMVDMMRKRFLVVEVLGVHHPSAVFLHDFAAQYVGAGDLERVFQQHPGRIVDMDEGETFEGRGERAVVGLGRRCEPALVDAAAVGAVCVIIVRVKLESPARDAERTGNPCRLESENSLAFI
jgi:hypothetical protein